MHNTALIDGDWLVFATVTSPDILHEFYHAELDEWSYKLNVDEAAKEVVAKSHDFTATAGCDNFVLCFGGHANFRKDLDPTYKANRKATRKPLGYRAVLERLEAETSCAWAEGYEGDDVMAMLSHRGQGNVMVSVDKDMKTVPGQLFNPMRPEEGVVTITQRDALYWLCYQTLCGDATDGYGGCKGIGPKTAEKILHDFDCDTLDAAFNTYVYLAYIKAGMTRANADLTAKLVQIVYDCEAEVQFSMPPVPKQYEVEQQGCVDILNKFMGAK